MNYEPDQNLLLLIRTKTRSCARDFLASDYCYDLELKQAMERHEADDAVVVPILLRSCDWKDALFGKLQGLPKDMRPVKEWPDRDQAFTDIVQGLRTVIKRLAAAPAAPPKPVPVTTVPVPSSPEPSVVAHPTIKLPPTPPTGPLHPQSPLYIERRHDGEARNLMAYTEAAETISIQSAGQTGASSLVRRMMEAAEAAGKKVASINFQQAFDDDDLLTVEAFHQRFCQILADRLDREDEFEKLWERRKSHGVSERCTYVMRQLLRSLLGERVVLALDEVDRLLDAEFRSDFFGMLRHWHSERGDNEDFERLDLALITSLEPHQLIDDPNQSPFNVGVVLRLEDFTPAEVARLNAAYGSPLTDAEVPQLIKLLGGHPALFQLALHRLATSSLKLQELIAEAGKDSGVFGAHLAFWYARLRSLPELRDGMIEVLRRREPDEMVFRKLRRVGLVRRDGYKVQLCCPLYETYFKEQFHV